ncbi:WD40 repeat domain-containing protein [Marinoscillum sp. MHG1-6]|uniref:WD40 repeat domain-containing protein n=1 Tax=Marinoscillum sp. MHG1-6 TaxID=2959627 RepID=UPI0021586DEF|nr:hypothetical protein [Marinoscillum sp. MHG1-6]
MYFILNRAPFRMLLILIITVFSLRLTAQDSLKIYKEKVKLLELTELVQSMTQRSLLIPGYQPELKALVARQAFNFWQQNEEEKLVSHLNVYASLHQANKFLEYDSSIMSYGYNQILGHSQMVVSLEKGSDPNYFYSAGSDGRVLKWNINRPKGIPTTIYEEQDLIRSIDVSDNDKWLMVVTKNSGVVIVNQESSAEIDQTIRDMELVQAATFLPNKDAYLTVNKKGEVKIKGYEYPDEAVGQIASKVLSVVISPEDYTAYLGTEAGNVAKIQESTGNGDLSIMFPKAYAINALDISPDHKLLAIGRELGDVVIWDIEAKEPLRIISGHESAVTDVEFSPDNTMLVSASRDGTARIWDIQNTRKLPIVLDDHEDWVMTVSYSRDGKQIITGSKDNFIRIWQVDPEVLADRICDALNRNLTEEEWKEYVGQDIPYQKTCE